MIMTRVTVGAGDNRFSFPVDYNDYCDTLAWRARYRPQSFTMSDFYEIAGVIEFYNDLLRDPGAVKVLQRMRKEVKAQDAAFRAVRTAMARE